MILPPFDPSDFAQRVPIGPGARGTVQTLDLAGKLAAAALLDPRFPLFVRRKILVETGIDPRDVPLVFGAIFDYIATNVGYQPDPLVYTDQATGESVTDYVQSPHWTLFVEGFGDCLSHASLAGFFAAALGHGFGFTTLKGDPLDPDRFSHVYAQLGYLSPQGPVWLACDTTVPGGEIGLEAPNLWRYSPAFYQVAAPN